MNKLNSKINKEKFEKFSNNQKNDFLHVFHPCSQMKDYEDLPPIVVTGGKGVNIYDEFGNRYIDGVSSWWTNLLGHCNEEINSVVKEQVSTLDHVIFANFTHLPAINLAKKITALLPGDLNKVIFSENGSSAVEISLKIAFHYFQNRNLPRKKKFVSLSDSYHGETLGALGVTDVDIFTRTYRPLINESIKVSGPNCSHCPYKLHRDTCHAPCFHNMEVALKENFSDIAAVIIEPISQCAAGMRIYSPVYLQKLRQLTKELDILLIADEIATGFGRTGKFFAIEHASITPDILCTGKGLTAGYFPMALTVIRDEIYSEFYNEYSEKKNFLHSHSYSGNPIGCAIASATIDILERENILEKNITLSGYIDKKIRDIILSDERISGYIHEYRNIGMIFAIEFSENLTNLASRAGYEIYKIALKNGAILRPLSNTLYFMPPYTISNSEVDELILIAHKSILSFLDSYSGKEISSFEKVTFQV